MDTAKTFPLEINPPPLRFFFSNHRSTHPLGATLKYNFVRLLLTRFHVSPQWRHMFGIRACWSQGQIPVNIELGGRGALLVWTLGGTTVKQMQHTVATLHYKHKT